MALTAVDPGGPVELLLLSQCDIDVAPASLEKQPHPELIEAQAGAVAEAFARFVGGARSSLDVCIYDFRLDFSSVRKTIVDAINAAADTGVTVRIAYDKAQDAEDGPILKQFRIAGGDPAPVGTEHFLTGLVRLHDNVHTRAVAEEAIDPGGQIMHQKFMVRDAGAQDAALWTGSTNFTVDAWALQENNIIVVSSCPQLAAAYEQDFEALWETQAIRATGVGDRGSADVAGQTIGYAFAPGEGKAIETTIATTIARAQRRLRVASMVTSSQAILGALRTQIEEWRDVAGIYDRGETDTVRSAWARTGHLDKVRLLDAVTARMVAKPSLTYAPQHAHNFMHNKLVVADNTVISGSFNFSVNATRNAENVLIFTDRATADVYTDSVDGLIARYSPPQSGDGQRAPST